MSFKLSRRSLDRLEGIDDSLQAVVKMAITLSRTDFGVVQGMRTLEQQKELVAKGASKTMKSKHLEGKAFDIMAFINGRASWELSLYDDLADAIKEAATQLGVPICWGAAWGTPDMPYPMDIRKWEGGEHTYYSEKLQAERTVVYPSTMEGAMNAYIDLRRDQNRRPFIDGPHFELID
jgi:peptidoglycan L-alanyl-D-glutamate endopeptidase CwlK